MKKIMRMFCDSLTLLEEEQSKHPLLWGNKALIQGKTV